MKITLTNARLAFPELFEAKTVNGEGKPAFSATFLIESDDAQIEKINAIIDAVALEKWGAKAKGIVEQLRKSDKTALHDGDMKSNYAGFEGVLYISARSQVAPLVIDRDKTPLKQASGRPYAGCYVNASIDIWAQDNNFGKRINASLGGVQFVRDGDAFSGGGATNPDEFDDLGVDADDALA